MDKLERFLMPIVIGIGLLGLLIAKTNEDTVVVIGRVVGIGLAILLSSGFIIRWILKFRRGKREIAAMRLEYEALLAQYEAEEAAEKRLENPENA